MSKAKQTFENSGRWRNQSHQLKIEQVMILLDIARGQIWRVEGRGSIRESVVVKELELMGYLRVGYRSQHQIDKEVYVLAEGGIKLVSEMMSKADRRY